MKNKVNIPRPQRQLTIKQQNFCKEYVKLANNEPIKINGAGSNGKPRRNATQAALNSYDIDQTDRDVAVASAGVIANENLKKLSIRTEIVRLLESNGVELDGIVSIHKRNMEQSEHLPTSQKAVSDFYRILGMDTPQTNDNVKVAFIIEGSG